jgi:predicted 3-demethylubiquinone-9 3-methyltransferase (glyoxalase superfamily)
MPIDKYFFSDRYGWLQDKFGMSWQLILTDPKGRQRPPIVPSMLFVGNNFGKAEEAINFYLSIFRNSKAGNFHYAGKEHTPAKPGTIMFADFMVEGTWLAAMDSGHKHDFVFNEALSFVVQCDSQDEIDYYWSKLSAVPEAEQCGWLKDKYGVSWQITPAQMGEMMTKGSPEQIKRVTQAFLPMKKMDLATLKKVYGSK